MTMSAALTGLLAAAQSGMAADIYGTITFKGTPPAEINIVPLKTDPNCGKFHQTMPTTHFYRVGPNKGFADVFVGLSGIQGKSKGASAKPLVIDQKGCEYAPYVAACQTGQKILVRNSDPILHNVHVTPEVKGNPEENQAQLAHAPDLTFEFKQPEGFIRFKCDVHPWMFAYVSAFDNPWFDVSKEDGTYRIHNVPTGEYTIEAAHRKAGTQNQKVTVNDKDVEVNFTFEQKRQGSWGKHGSRGYRSALAAQRKEAG